jgi:hypothetical protein
MYINKKNKGSTKSKCAKQRLLPATQDRILEEQRERIRQQRATEFEAALARMNEDQEKAALKKKKRRMPRLSRRF